MKVIVSRVSGRSDEMPIPGCTKESYMSGTREVMEWFYELKSLEELFELTDELGHQIIVGSAWFNGGSYYCIQIYDGYNE